MSIFCVHDREFFRCNNDGILTVINRVLPFLCQGVWVLDVYCSTRWCTMGAHYEDTSSIIAIFVLV
jgi:hypothetical protein